MVPELPDPVLVADRAAFGELLEELARHDELAIDTEADSFFSYREKVCLVQVSAGGRDYLIDPLGEIDLAPFGEVLADPARVKVFHDGEYDVLLFKREYGFEFENLFDTRLAASALGVENPGLASVLHSHFGVELDKSQQRSNWGARPLTRRQIDYARLDTHFLLDLRREQLERLQEAGRLRIVEGECRRLESLAPNGPRLNPDDWVRLRGARDLSPRRRRALRELFLLREELASEADQPPFRVLQNACLIEIARELPRTSQELAEIDGVSWRQVRRLGDRVLEVLERAAALEPIRRLPQLPRRDGTGDLDQTGLELYERLKSWRKRRAEREGFDASLVLNRHAMIRLAQHRPSGLEELTEVEGVLPWQVELLGEELIEVVSTFEADLAAGRIEPGRRSRAYRDR